MIDVEYSMLINIIIQKKNFLLMVRQNPFQLILLLFYTLFISFASSTVILQDNIIPLVLVDQQQYLKKLQSNFNKPNLYSNTNYFKQYTDSTLFDKQNNNQNQPTYQSLLQQAKIQPQKLSSNSNLFQFQRPQQKPIDNFPDQQSNIYTNKLSLISALGIEINSKIMQYVQKKIQCNRKIIWQHNNMKRIPYSLAENRFIIYTPQQFKQIFLTLQEPDQQNYQRNIPKQITVQSPKSNLRKLQQVVTVNWRTAKKMTSVKYQQGCGACYSFTPIGAIQSAYLIKGVSLNLAQQQIIDCSTPYDNYGCIGGWSINSYRYIQAIGVLFQSDYPYVADFNNCSIPTDKPKYFIKNYVELANDCNAVVQALKNQPLSIAINADGWQYYSSGIYTDCRKGASNHGVVLAGVDADVWLIKNSWGFSWGQQGYIRVSRTAPNEACNVCRWASYPVV